MAKISPKVLRTRSIVRQQVEEIVPRQGDPKQIRGRPTTDAVQFQPVETTSLVTQRRAEPLVQEATAKQRRQAKTEPIVRNVMPQLIVGRQRASVRSKTPKRVPSSLASSFRLGHVRHELIARPAGRQLKVVVATSVAVRQTRSKFSFLIGEPKADLKVGGLKSLLPPMAELIHLPTRLMAFSTAVTIQLRLKVEIVAIERRFRQAVATTITAISFQEPLAMRLRQPLRPTPNTPCPLRSVGPCHTVRVPPRGLHAAVVVDVRRLLIVQTAIGPVETQELRQGRLLRPCQATGFTVYLSHLIVLEGKVEDQDGPINTERLQTQAQENMKLMKVGAPSAPVVLLHAAKAWSRRASSRMPTNGRDTLLSIVMPSTSDELITPRPGRLTLPTVLARC